MAIRHLRKQFNRIFPRFGDDNGFRHTLRVLSEGAALSSKRRMDRRNVIPEKLKTLRRQKGENRFKDPTI
jgi:hypothetical protein